jgi:hypothetical protein
MQAGTGDFQHLRGTRIAHCREDLITGEKELG